ncbi:MAG: DUF3078 domain-containing protein [Bacteroidaceae bacterium]|nr:DUF3078 domain-containing protein [Bacteroidaceae bacterium]
MNIQKYLVVVCVALFAPNSFSQKVTQLPEKNAKSANVESQQVVFNNDSLLIYNDLVHEKYVEKLNQLKQDYSTWTYKGNDILTNPYYYPVFFLSRLSNTVFSESIGSLNENVGSTDFLQKYDYINTMLTQSFTATPNQIIDLADAEKVEIPKPTKDEKPVVAEVKQTKTQSATPETVDEFDEAWSLVVKKPNFWKFKSNFSLQFSQSYISSNWYRGGQSYKNMLTTFNLEANYDNKRGFKFDNRVEMRLGFQNTDKDNTHKLKTHADQIRMTNKIGLKATKNWYYTISLQSWTQFYKGYRANDETVYSDFMSPFESVASVGMDYSLRVKNFEFNTTLSPFAGKLKYCDRKNLVNNFGLRDKHSRFEFGSNISGNFKWTISKNIQWSGRIYYFTDYKKAQAEWENTISLRINKYLSTKLYLYPRFDDSANRHPDKGYLQFKEDFSLGVDLSF